MLTGGDQEVIILCQPKEAGERGGAGEEEGRVRGRVAGQPRQLQYEVSLYREAGGVVAGAGVPIGTPLQVHRSFFRWIHLYDTLGFAYF